jgi:hypothetical protein
MLKDQADERPLWVVIRERQSEDAPERRGSAHFRDRRVLLLLLLLLADRICSLLLWAVYIVVCFAILSRLDIVSGTRSRVTSNDEGFGHSRGPGRKFLEFDLLPSGIGCHDETEKLDLYGRAEDQPRVGPLVGRGGQEVRKKGW